MPGVTDINQGYETTKQLERTHKRMIRNNPSKFQLRFNKPRLMPTSTFEANTTKEALTVSSRTN
jgi:hypothetical protein